MTVKEILDKLKYTAKKHTIQVLENGGKIEHCPQVVATEMRLNTYSANILLNYITNLQEENERLTQGVALLTSKIIDMTKAKEDYKSRIDKAIEYIEKCIDSEDIYEQFLSTSETKEVLNILKGGDNNE